MIAPFTVSAILGGSLKIVARYCVLFFVVGFLSMLPVLMYGSVKFVAVERSFSMDQLFIDGLISLILSLLGFSFFSGSVSAVSLQFARHGQVQFVECLSVALRRSLPLLGVVIFCGALLFVAYLILIIPALILLSLLYMTPAICTVERRGVFGSISRSAELSYGYRWKIFAVYVVIIFLSLLVPSFLNQFFVHLDLRVLEPFVIVGAMYMLSTWHASAATLTYYHLRNIKESVHADQVAKIFE